MASSPFSPVLRDEDAAGLDALAAVSTVDLRVTDESFNSNLWGSIKAITPPFIGDYVGLVADATSATRSA
jgi:hypothetical protein